MYARVSTYEGGTNEDYDRSLDALRSDLVPKVRAMQGCAGLLSLVDRSSGTALTITLWDSEDSLVSSGEAAKGIRKQAADATGSSVGSVVEYEVGVADLS